MFIRDLDDNLHVLFVIRCMNYHVTKFSACFHAINTGICMIYHKFDSRQATHVTRPTLKLAVGRSTNESLLQTCTCVHLMLICPPYSEREQ